MSRTVRIALVQQSYVPFDLDGNLAKAEAAVREAADGGADLVCLPEMFLTGYPMFRGADGNLRTMPHVPLPMFVQLDEEDDAWGTFRQRFRETAEPEDGPHVRRIGEIAADCGVVIVAGICELGSDRLYNAAFVFDPDGRHVGTYRKVHTAHWFPGEYLCEPGDSWHVWPLCINGHDVRVGVAICCDREYPEAFRALMLKGADVVLVPNAGGINDMRLMQLRVRGFENAVAVGMANHAEDYGGRSMVVDPRGAIVAEADEAEQIVIGDIDLDALADVRETALWCRFRRPETYGILCETPNTPTHRHEDTP